MRNLPITLLLAGSLALSSCGSDSEAAIADTAEPGVDSALPDAGPEPDTGPGVDATAPEDTGTPDVGEPEWTPGPVAPDEEPVPVEIASWVSAVFVNGTAAAVFEALGFDTFELPEEGSYLGLYWNEAPTGEDSTIPLNGQGNVFVAATRVTVAADMAVIARPDGMGQVSVMGSWATSGDPYRSGKHRVPLFLREGDNTIVVFGGRRNNLPRFDLFSTTHEIVFVTTDVTSPELEQSVPHATYVGLPILAMRQDAIVDVRLQVVDSEYFEATERRVPSLAGGASVQAAFELVVKPGLPTDGTPVTATLRVESPSLEFSYEQEIELPVRDVDGGGRVVRRTFLSRIDRSAQLYGANEPTEVEAGKDYSLVLSTHGAGVGGKGQAAAYGSKDWHYVIAPTNRRPFGFDWESYGRLDGMEVLDLAMESYAIDPTRVYLSGHSMGGHGSWQLGHLYPGRFALIGPSAGWIDFSTYNGTLPDKNGPFGWAALSSYTRDYSENLAKRAVYVVHGTADDNVPLQQAEIMLDHLEPIVEDLHFHFEEGAGHWWDGYPEPGAACVDWPDMFAMMQERSLDPWELDFTFISPSPAVSPTHSYVTIVAAADPRQPVRLESAVSDDGAGVTLTANNASGLRLAGDALLEAGITEVVVNGDAVPVGAGSLEWGEQSGKHPDVYGPLVQVFQQPFCLVWDDNGPAEYPEYAAELLTSWNIIGNGTGCALPLSAVTDAVRAAHNMVYLGVPLASVPLPADSPMSWEEGLVSVDGNTFSGALLAFVFPEGDRLGAVITTTRTAEYLLGRVSPFSSRFWLPDWIVLEDEGVGGTGFFDRSWTFETPGLNFFP